MLRIFHFRYINFLPFFALEIYLSKRNTNSFEKIFQKAVSKYNIYKPSSRVFFEIDKIDLEDIYFFSGGKKKHIAIQAYKGYLNIFKIDMEYRIFDLYSFNNVYFITAMILKKMGYEGLSDYFNKRGAEKIYSELKEYIMN